MGQLINREYIVFRGSNISCTLACGLLSVHSVCCVLTLLSAGTSVDVLFHVLDLILLCLCGENVIYLTLVLCFVFDSWEG